MDEIDVGREEEEDTALLFCRRLLCAVHVCYFYYLFLV